MKKIFLVLLMLSIFANTPSDVFSWSGQPSSSVNLANSAGAAVTPKQNLAKGEAGGGGAVPVGFVLAWPASSNPPDADKWLECKGQTITAAAYPELYAVVGSQVPDYQGYFLRGYGGNSSSLGVQQGDAIRNITGTMMSGGRKGNPQIHGGNVFGGSSGVFNVIYGASRGWVVASTGSQSDQPVELYFSASNMVPTANENRPINKAVRYLIRAKS